ncbi:hypothetical protein D9599_21375 [Roseomonas sp. KE2513]|nr:hypothetical protein [Roseomonas sp. KE2513]
MFTRTTAPLRQDADRALPAAVFCMVGFEEWSVPVAPGADRWGAVAQLVGQAMGCGARVDEAPVYDSGTRSWTLAVTLVGRRRGRVLSVPVRW